MVTTLAELARGPDVTGSISRGAITGGQLAQLAQLQRQNRAAAAVDAALAGGVPMGREARGAAVTEAARSGGALGATGLLDAFNALDAPERERQAAEARIFAQELAGATDQASWDAARARLDANPNVDASLLSPTFDPNQRTSIINAAREVEDIVGDVLSPEAQRQAIERAQAGRAQGSTTIINAGPQGQDFGDPPKDTVWARNPDGTVATQPVTLPSGTDTLQPIAIPIEGGTVAQARAAEESAAEARQAAAEGAARRVSTSADEIRRLVDESVLPTTGITGSLLSNLGGPARDVASELQTIRANASFETLQQMRNQNPSGGALGQVSNVEIDLLQNSIGSLEQAQSREQFLRNLDRVEREFEILAAGTPEERDALVAQFEASQGGDVMPDQANMPRPTTQEGYDALPVGAWYIDPDSGQPARKGR